MAFRDWVDDTYHRFREHPPIGATKKSVRDLKRGFARRWFNNPNPDATPIFESNWDLLIVLDTCRPDALKEVAPEYEWLPEPEKIDTEYSLGSYSGGWMERNFTPEYEKEMASTAHVTWNPFTHKALNSEDWKLLDEVWRDGWDDEDGVVRPETLTDRAIVAGRTVDADRYIAHYMQPHEPYPTLDLSEPIPQDSLTREDDPHTPIWQRIDSGEVDVETVWDHYLKTLRWGLDEVERLLKNCNAERAIITADHGELFGEWGFYGHPWNVHIDELTKVPWVAVEASDKGTSQPTVERDQSEPADAAQERLEALGYI